MVWIRVWPDANLTLDLKGHFWGHKGQVSEKYGKKSYNSLYAITESCKMYRCANNIYINNQFYHPKSLFHNVLYFNEINCIFWEYFIDLLLRRRHYFSYQ